MEKRTLKFSYFNLFFFWGTGGQNRLQITNEKKIAGFGNDMAWKMIDDPNINPG
jgi:hypothetical protein